MKKLIVIIGLLFMCMNTGCELLRLHHEKTELLPDPDNPLVRKTNYGLIEGIKDDDETWSWRGVPFAAPPVGDLRWRAPRDPESWEDTLETREFSDVCPHYMNDPDNPTGTMGIGGSEDCLYLNIWRPQTDETGLPVYVWIHGGGNSVQMPLNSELKGARIAKKSNMVVVNFNYRLGPLGWFSHPDLRDGDKFDNSGNYGTLDMIKVLDWIRVNIKNFGGDPGNVTVTGESAGAQNTLSLLIAKPAKGLLHKGIVQSGGLRSATVRQGEIHAKEIAHKLLVKDGLVTDPAVAETQPRLMTRVNFGTYLREKSPQEILACYTPVQGGTLTLPTVFNDGAVIPEDGFDGLTSGRYVNKIPLILGTNTYEWKTFLISNPAFSPIFTGAASPELVELYSLVAKYTSDLWTISGADNIARRLTKHRSQPDVYVYTFNWGAADTLGGGVIPEPAGLLLGSSHGMDIDFFFGRQEKRTTGNTLMSRVYTDENEPGRLALSDAIMAYAARFARTGSPNSDETNLPEWFAWGNTPEASLKRIVLDADFENYIIEMSSRELTSEGVMADLRAEPRYEEILPFLTTFTETFSDEVDIL